MQQWETRTWSASTSPPSGATSTTQRRSDLLEDGDYVIAQWEGGGTHAGKALTELPHGGPIPAGSGREVFFSGTSILKVENGKVTEEIGQEGAIDALLQLGAVNETAPEQ